MAEEQSKRDAELELEGEEREGYDDLEIGEGEVVLMDDDGEDEEVEYIYEDEEAERAEEDGAARREVERLRAELAELKDRSMRAMADFDNYRKRAERERADLKRYALVEPLRDFLPVVDNLERALSSGGSVENLKTGVEMILRQMHELLQRFGARAVPGRGAPFDPKIHEAISRQEDPEVEEPTVAEEMQRGYTLEDRLLRPALVTVAVPRRPAAEESGEEGEDGGDGEEGDVAEAAGVDDEGDVEG